jgi:hypothetical protein
MKPRSPRQSTVPAQGPPRTPRKGAPPRSRSLSTRPPSQTVARIIDPAEASLLDVIDNLLNKGVVLNADVVLALADVDLVYLRLSALLCAADRLLPRGSAR